MSAIAVLQMTIKGETHFGEVVPDCNAGEFENPLNKYAGDDAAPILLCWHSRYSLGTENALPLLVDQIRANPLYRAAWEEEYLPTPTGGWYENKHYLDLSDIRDAIKGAQRCGFLILPLFLFDHSGLTINTMGFSCPWDSGQVGFIIWSSAARKKWQGEYWKRDSDARRKKDVEHMRSIVAEYDLYLRGEIYGLVLYDALGKELDSVWGFIGHHYAVRHGFYDCYGADAGSLKELRADLETAIEALAKAA